MEGRPSITIVMTVKNGVPYLEHSINSILEQKFQNWSAIIVDDGSEDDSPRFLKSLESFDQRFSVVCTQGVGRGCALNIAADAVKTEYFLNLDADDILCAHALSAMSQLSSNHPLPAVISGEARIFSGEASALPGDFENCTLKDVTGLLRYGNQITHSGALIKKRAVFAIGGYNENRRGQFDYDLWVRLALNGFYLYRSDAVFVGKRKHEKQSFEKRGRLKYLFGASRVQGRAILGLNQGRILPFIVLVARFAWGLTPGKVRFFAKRMLTSSRF